MFNIHSWYTVHKLKKLIEQKKQYKVQKKFKPEPGNLLYVLASCLPFHISGYTTRTQEILKNLQSICNSSGNKIMRFEIRILNIEGTGKIMQSPDFLKHRMFTE